MSLQIAREGGIEPVVDVIVKPVGPNVLCPFVLTDNNMLGHLAVFPSTNNMLPLHYAGTWRNLCGDES